MANDTSTSRSGYGAIALAHWRLVLACGVIAAGVALALSLAQEKVYEATASLVFRGTAESNTDPARLAGTNEKLVSLGTADKRTAGRLDGFTKDEVAAAVDSEPVGVSNIVSITATDSDPETAAELADTYAESFIQIRRRADAERLRADRVRLEREYDRLDDVLRQGPQGRALQQRIGEVKAAEVEVDNAFEVATSADVPADAASPRPGVNAVLGMVLGLLVGFTLSIGLERLRGP